MSKIVPLSRRGGELLLRLLEQQRPLITAAALEEYLLSPRPGLVAVGALEFNGSADSMIVVGDEGPIFRDLSPQTDRNANGYFDAADGSVAVAPDDQKLWRVSMPWWLAWLASALDLTNCSQPTELVVGHAWDVGDLWIDRRRKVPLIFARRLHREEYLDALCEALKKRAGRGVPLILTSSRHLPSGANGRLSVTPVSLSETLTNDAHDFAIDGDVVRSPYLPPEMIETISPLWLSDDGRMLVINGVKVTFRSQIHIAIVRQIVTAHGIGVVAREVLEKAGASATTFRQAFGVKKWALLRPFLISKGGRWDFYL